MANTQRIIWIRRIDLVSFVVFSEVQAQIRRIFVDGYGEALRFLVNQEIMEDALRVEDYRRMSCQLKESIRRKCGYIGALKAGLRNVVSNERLRFLERMHLKDMEKCTHFLLMKKETEMKIGEKIAFVELLGDNVVVLGAYECVSIAFVVVEWLGSCTYGGDMICLLSSSMLKTSVTPLEDGVVQVIMVDKDRSLVLLNQEINEDVARVREYRDMACGLNIAIRRRKEYVKELKALGDSEDAFETMMFMKRMEFDDKEKCTRSLSTMKETEVKICEKASMAGDSVSSVEQASYENEVAVSSVERGARESGNEDMNGLLSFLVDQEIMEDRGSMAGDSVSSVEQASYENEVAVSSVERGARESGNEDMNGLLSFLVDQEIMEDRARRYGERHTFTFNVEGDRDEDEGKRELTLPPDLLQKLNECGDVTAGVLVTVDDESVVGRNGTDKHICVPIAS
uniref:Uncharacterized protein n=1 Tax=Tanacetum cinerariifolium TaxID=118510 RepID=A0A6L2JZ15_TANCI|nr:hypothetical protein [Tanacetum cinerariifolium]